MPSLFSFSFATFVLSTLEDTRLASKPKSREVQIVCRYFKHFGGMVDLPDADQNFCFSFLLLAVSW
jgi:hypothetical protein